MKALVLLILLAGCASVFDTEEQAIRELEAKAYVNRQYDKKDIQIVYQFVDNPDLVCRRAGVLTHATWTINACAMTGIDPCVIILPYAPTKAWVREEQLHCRYGNWHKGGGVK